MFRPHYFSPVLMTIAFAVQAAPQGEPPAPPDDAIQACVNQQEGGSCTVGNGDQGLCQYTPDQQYFACNPRALQQQDGNMRQSGMGQAGGMGMDAMPGQPAFGGQGMNGMSGQPSFGNQGMSGERGGRPHSPPEDAIQACENQQPGSACTVGNGESGVCQFTPDQQYFACKPDSGGPQGGPGMGEPGMGGPDNMGQPPNGNPQQGQNSQGTDEQGVNRFPSHLYNAPESQ